MAMGLTRRSTGCSSDISFQLARWAADVALQHARGLAMEAAAALDTLHVLTLVTESGYVRGIGHLEGIVAMPTRMT
jgi:hypothetical protein